MVLVCDMCIVDIIVLIGLLEVKLGLMFGFGGMVCLFCFIGLDNVFEWMIIGCDRKGEKVFVEGVVDVVVVLEVFVEGVFLMVKDVVEGKFDW